VRKPAPVAWHRTHPRDGPLGKSHSKPCCAPSLLVLLVLLLPVLRMVVLRMPILLMLILLMVVLSIVMLVLRLPGVGVVVVRVVMMLVRYAAETGEAQRKRYCAEYCGAKSHKILLSGRKNPKIGIHWANARWWSGTRHQSQRHALRRAAVGLRST
jgi:hypothetical protein